MLEIISVPVDVRGELSKRHYEGVFTVKTLLSFREMLREDELRRTMLGANPDGAAPFIASVAQSIAYLGTRIMEAPGWWKDAKGGLDLKDDNVLRAVNLAVTAAIDAEFAKETTEADKAADALRAKL